MSDEINLNDPNEPGEQAGEEKVKLQTDPVSIRCKGYKAGVGEATPKEIKFTLAGQTRIIPIGGTMQSVVTRGEAEKFLVKVKRYWTAEPDLEIVEPKFG